METKFDEFFCAFLDRMHDQMGKIGLRKVMKAQVPWIMRKGQLHFQMI